MSLNVLSLGGSRNIGYFSAIRMLDSGANVTFLLRNLTTFDSDETIQKYVKLGKAHLVKGDALVKEDVQHSWNEATKESPVDLLLFTVGGTPKFSITRGMVTTPANLVTESLFNVLTTIPKTDTQPRIIVISSTGLTRTSHEALPLPLKPLYAYLLAVPHRDKVGVERLISHCTGWPWNSEKDGEPAEEIMGPNWKETPSLPAAGSLKRVLVIRPALLTDGECRAEELEKKEQKRKEKNDKKEKKEKEKKEKEKKEPAYRVSEEELGGWTVSRKDVAHFISDAVLHHWNDYENKCVSIAY